MTLYSAPPSYREFRFDKPSLLVCWWATALCTCIILLRIIGRFVRTERLFPEDRIAALTIVPLFLRMGCVHFILVHGTNNVDLDGVTLSPRDHRLREISSGLVLLSRVLYAATLWILKNTILEFFRRLTDVTWERSYRTSLVAIRWLLIITFGAVIISDLAECQPFNHYWQVTPDPGPQCRQGYAQLITTAVCNIVTDLLLVFFPIPIILRSHMTIKRKVQLTLLFSLSLGVVGVTLYRVPHVIQEDGRQAYRSLLASVELIFATAAANALVLGSFVRDRGLKKQKFRRSSVADSFDRSSNQRRRPTLHQQWGSDEDLVRDMGIGVDPDLRNRSAESTPQPAPLARGVIGEEIAGWQFPQRNKSQTERSDTSLLPRDQFIKADNFSTPRRVSFFDVGGLLEESPGTSSSSYRRGSHASSSLDPPPIHAQPSPTRPAESGRFRRGSTALLQDLGGLLSPRTTPSRSKRPVAADLEEASEPPSEQTSDADVKSEPVLQDAGGLLK